MLWTALAAGYGAVAGLLLPRAVYRLAVEPDEPRRDRCPDGHPLGGRARGWLGPAYCYPCALPYGPPRLFYPLAGALVCGVLTAVVGIRPELAVWLLATPVALLLAAVDRAVHRLPDVLVLPLALGLATLLGVASRLPGADGSWRGALLGGLALGGFYLVLFLARSRELGFGDVKLGFALGMALGWYGWDVLLTGAFLGALLLAVYGLTLLAAGRAERDTWVPAGPFMMLGTLTGVLLGAGPA